MANVPRTPAGFRSDLTVDRMLPGTGAVMSAWDRILKSRGLDYGRENEAAMQKRFNEWAEEQIKRGLPVNATEFNKYLAASAAYALHQGRGGQTQANQTARAFGGKNAPFPKTIKDFGMF